MKYEYKDLSGSIKHLEINLSQAEFAKYWEVVREEAIKNVELKGFRKGTAPKEMASAAIDQEKVFNEAAIRAIREILKEITEEKQWEIIDQPKIDIEEKGNDLIFKVDITVFPEVELGDYKKIAAKIFSEKIETSSSDEEVNEAINWILNSRAKIVRSAGVAKMGDVVNITYKGKDDQFILGHSHIEEGECEHCAAGEESKTEHEHNESAFDKKIVGHKEGEEFDGIKLTGVFERQVPEMTDTLAQELGKFKNVDELKASIKDGIQKEKEIKEKEKLKIKVLEEIVKNSKMDLPEVMVEKTLAGMLEEYKIYFQKDFKEDEIKIKLRPEAEKSVASNLALYKIAKDEKIEPNAEEVEAESNKFLATMRPDTAAKIDPQRVYNYSYDIVKNKKVFEFLEKLK